MNNKLYDIAMYLASFEIKEGSLTTKGVVEWVDDTCDLVKDRLHRMVSSNELYRHSDLTAAEFWITQRASFDKPIAFELPSFEPTKDYRKKDDEYNRHVSELKRYRASPELAKLIWDRYISCRPLEIGVDFKIDPMYPEADVTGQEQYSSTMQQAWSERAVPMDAVLHAIDGNAIDEKPNRFNLDESDIVAAVQYGMWYAVNSQHDGTVPYGNVMQWLCNRKGLLEMPS